MKIRRSAWTLAGVVVFAALVASGVEVAQTSQQMRALFSRLSVNQAKQDALLHEHSRLLLERGALSAYQNVDRIAEDVLAMQFPDEVERIIR
ncbi:MAG: cell division protein FtsL [Gammaproteobacteria bacterium]|nr:cell division protein FtsL [Gammaproteobacteria bacterium]